MASPTRPRGGLLHHADFLKLWSAETVSQFGTQVSQLAIPLTAVLILEATPFEVALLGTIEFLPFILFTLPAGAWVDRLRRRPLMIVGDVGRGVALGTIPVAYALGDLTLIQLYVVGFVTGTLTVLFDVAYQSYLPSVVERDQLIEGNSKLQISVSAAQIAGPGIAGYLVGLIKAPFAILFDALSFFASAGFVFLIRRPEPPVVHHADASGVGRPSIVDEIKDGLRFVLRNRSLRGIAFGTGSSNLFGNFAQAILIVYMVRELGLSPVQIGLIFGIGAVGFLVGALVANRVANVLGLGPTIIGSLALSAPALFLIALAPASNPLPCLIAAQVLFGLAVMIYNINQVSYRQAICPPRMQGRMNATMRFVVWGTIPIGSLIGGALASMGAIGLHGTIWIAAVLSLIPAVFPLLSPVRHLRTMPEPIGDEPSSATGAIA